MGLLKTTTILLTGILIFASNQILAQPNQEYIYTYEQPENAIELTGQWEFQFGQTYKSLDQMATRPIQVPGSWDQLPKDSSVHTFGYARYECTLINKTQDHIGILFPFLVEDYRIEANHKIIYESKHFNDNIGYNQPARIRAFFSLPDADTIQLRVLVKNTHTRFPGINLPPVVNRFETLQVEEENRKIYEFTGIGILFIISFYHLILFLFLRSRSMLWLALISFIIGMRASVVYDGSFLLYNVFPWLNFFIAKKIEYGLLYLTPALTPLLFRDQFYIKKHDRWIKILSVISVIMFLVVLVLPVHLFEATIDVFHLFVLIGLILALDILRIAVLNKLRTARIVLSGLVITSILVILEILKTSNVIFIDIGTNILNNAMVVYIFIQAVAISARMALVYQEHKYLNEHLEKSVEQKTIELSEANNTRSRIISVVTHDLMNPLTNLKGTINLMEMNVLTPEDLEKMKDGLIDQINRNIGLMEEVLGWSSLELKKEHQDESLKICDIHETTETVSRQLKQFALDKRIKLVNEVSKESQVHIDADAAVIILRNLIANAIKFTNTNGKVEVSSEMVDGFTRFSVADDGIGIPDEMKQKIFKPDSSGTRYGTGNEKGRGVGLLIVKDLVQQHGGKIWVADNPKNTGTIFYFELPKVYN